MNELFEKESIPKAYFTLALPVVLGMVASMIYNLADTFFIAQTQNTDLVAGVALCTPLFSFLLALGDIFGLGGSSLISRLLGQTEHEKSRRVSSFCFYWGDHPWRNNRNITNCIRKSNSAYARCQQFYLSFCS